MSALLLFPARPMPTRSAASRRCAACDQVDRFGTYGPPSLGILAHPGGYALEELEHRWFCSSCSATYWLHWREPDIVERRRREVWAEVARRREALEVWDRQLELRGAA